MKRILSILLAISTFATQVSNAQNCPATPTYSNVSGTVDLSSGRSIVLNNGGTFYITVTNSFSSTSSICVLNGSTLNLSFLNVNSAQSGGNIYVEKKANLVFTGGSINNFPLTITNNGTVNQASIISYGNGATINNTGTYTINAAATLNTGTVTINNSGTFNVNALLGYNSGLFNLNNSATGTVTFSSNLTISNSTITNSGTINCNGFVTIQNESVVTNNGYIYLQNILSNNLTFSGATFTNNGLLYTLGSILINTGSTLTNTCTIRTFANFTNNGTVKNNGSILLSVNSLFASFLNQGSFTNGLTGFVQGTTFTNNSNISGGGNFYFSGLTTNQGPFSGTSATSKINFYDATGSFFGTTFDIQNSSPVNTTKNAIAANNATTFTSCADVIAPVITLQPSIQILCSTSATEAKFSVTATSKNAQSYQWKKNGVAISGATSSIYTSTGLTLADTLNVYSVAITNAAGTTISNNASVKYIIIAQPSPLTQYIATGNAVSFAIQTSGATAWQWQKGGSNISGATSVKYPLSVVNYADSGNYTVQVSYNGGVCTSNAAVLKTSIVLYSKATGNLNLPATWGVEAGGSGSTPVDFTREEHTFIVANRTSAETGGNLTIAGKLNVANSKVIITPNTTLNAGRITRELIAKSSAPGVLSGSATASLTVHGITSSAYAGASDLYFDGSNNTIKNLVIAGHAVTLHTALNITSGKDFGTLQVNSGTFVTSDSLTLKSDSLGTAGIAKSVGTISGKVTIEKFIHARRAWRFMGAPVSATDAPSIHTAWQEGAVNSTDNPHPGYGTHITGGTEANGFDRSPTNHASIEYINASGKWTGLANTNATPVTQYPAYMFFIRGNRSYDILTTKTSTTPMTTTMRVTGRIYQGKQPAKAVLATGFTVAVNPYASPVNFAKMLSTSTNVKKRIRVWDPTLAGAHGVGGWVTIDGTTGTYRSTPPSPYVSTVLQAGQGFLLESADGKTSGSLIVDEDDKDFATTINADRETTDTRDTSLEVNLKVFNDDNTTDIADGVLYNFGTNADDSLDVNDAVKISNVNENLSVNEGSNNFTIDNRTIGEGDSLKLKIGGVSTASYQLEFVPASLSNQSLALYDKYLNAFSPISAVDTTHITFTVTAAPDSRASDRFTIVVQKTKIKTTISPLTFTNVKAEAKDKSIGVEWNAVNETGVLYYQVQKSADGITFSAAGNVAATGSGNYTFTDAAPATGINYYRIKSISQAGDAQYAPVVNAQLNAITAASGISVYPNPLTGTSFTLTLSGMEAGAYTMSIVNQNGTTLFSKSLAHSGGTASQHVTLPNRLSAGVYFLKITSATGTISSTTVAAN